VTKDRNDFCIRYHLINGLWRPRIKEIVDRHVAGSLSAIRLPNVPEVPIRSMLLMKISPQVYVFPLLSGKVNLGMVREAVVEPGGGALLRTNNKKF
jgi:hypothetical protein